MSTNFPTSLDVLQNPTPTDYLNSPSHAGQHANANDAIEAIQAKLGIDSSAVTTSHDYKLSEITGTDKAVGKTATQTLTNKTITSPIIKSWDGWQAVSDSWSYASADAPTFTITVPSGAASLYSVGMRIKLTQNTVKYFIITAVSNTGILTVYGGTDYTLVNADISDISYSTQKAPLGFPLNPNKWTIVSGTISVSQANPTANQYYNKATYEVPIGAWRIYLEGSLYGERNTSGVNEIWAGLGTANNNVNLLKLIFSTWLITGGGSITASKEFYVELSSKTNYYLNIGCSQAGIGIMAFGNVSSGYFRAICAYL